MVHRAICGFAGGFTGILIEHYAGHFPAVARGRSRPSSAPSSRTRQLRQRGRRPRRAAPDCGVELDLRNEKINYKVREHSLPRSRMLLVVGKKEARTGRCRSDGWGSQEQKVAGLDEALAGWWRRRWRRM